MHTPIPIPVNEIIHTYAHPYCGDATCPCHVPLSDANAEAVAHIMTIERGMSLQEARETLRMTTQDLGDDYTATYDSETHSLQLVRAGSHTRFVLTSEVCERFCDLLNAVLPAHEDIDPYMRWRAKP